jgi:hypothetical protein
VKPFDPVFSLSESKLPYKILFHPSSSCFFRKRHLKLVMLAFPELLSRCPTSNELATLLKGTRLVDEHWFQKEWPHEGWEAPLYTWNQACEAYCNAVPTNCKPVSTDCESMSTDQKPVLKRRGLNRISGRIKHFFNRDQQQDKV